MSENVTKGDTGWVKYDEEQFVEVLDTRKGAWGDEVLVEVEGYGFDLEPTWIPVNEFYPSK